MLHFIFDTETTDLIGNSLQPIHKQPKIIEFYGMILDDKAKWKKVDEFETYINCGESISEITTKITGIKQSDLEGQPTFRMVEPSVTKIIQRSDVAAAHNLSYDYTVINFEYTRLNKRLKWPSRRVCTVEATEHFKGFRLNLTALHEHLFGEGFPSAHRARSDVEATGRCYVELHKRGEL